MRRRPLDHGEQNVNGRGAHRPTDRTRRRAGRALAATALAAAATVSLAGCQWTSTVQTQKQYIPADGTQADVGQIQLRNVVVVADKKGGPGNVVGLVVNSSNDPVDVSVQGAQGHASFQVPAGGTEQFSPEGQPMTLPQVQGAPGELTTLEVQTSAGNVNLQPQVMAPIEYYRTLAPTGSGASPTDVPTTGGTQGSDGSQGSPGTESQPSESPTTTQAAG